MEQTLDLTELINKDVVNFNLTSTSKEEAIKELTHLLFEKGAVSSKQEFLNDVFERENQGQTGIGNGIAIPHGKSESVKKTMIAIGRSKVDLKWETIDDEPVHNVILFAVKAQDKNDLHLKLLAKIAGSLADEDVCKRFKEAQKLTDVMRLFEEN